MFYVYLQSQVTVTLVVLDVNDNKPSFLQSPYAFTVNEVSQFYNGNVDPLFVGDGMFHHILQW